MKITITGWTLYLALCLSINSKAQYVLVRVVLGNGGTVAAQEDFRMAMTLGQPAIGLTTDPNNHIGLGFWYTALDVVTDIEDLNNVARPGVELSQNFPNPFNISTTIEFKLPQNENIQLSLLDQFGRTVKVLLEGYMSKGTYKYVVHAYPFPNGVYFYQLKAGNYFIRKKCIIQ